MAKAKKKVTKKPANKAAKSSGDNSKACAALSYLLIGIIWYFADDTMKKNKFCKFHAKQGLAFLIVAIAGNFILGMLIFIGWALMPIWQIAMLILMVFGIINAVNGKEAYLPVIGQLGDKFNF